MDALVKNVFRSELLEIKNFLCQCTACKVSAVEYQNKFSISYVRKGNFTFKVFRSDLDSFNGYFLVNKPGHEHRVAHQHHIPDECTIFSFATSFYEQIADFYRHKAGGFFKKPDAHSILLKSGVKTDYLHNKIFGLLQSGHYTTLQIESLVIDLIDNLFSADHSDYYQIISPSFKKNYLNKIESAKYLIQEKFDNTVTLDDIAANANLSPFHFARIFKHFTHTSPHQYLLQYRISHAEYLLKNSTLPVTEIGYLSGFNSPDHFSASFSKRNGVSPITFREN